MALAQRSVLRIVEPPRSPDLAGLISSIAAGDETASSHLYDSTSGLLFGLLLLILGDTTKAEEVLAEVYAEVRQHAARFDQNRDSLLIWLITIAHRRALEHLCSSAGDQQFVVSVGLAVQASSDQAGSFGISKSAHRRLVIATLEALSPLERKMIELAYFGRMTTPAIASQFRQSPAKVKTSLRLGISQLYKLFKNPGFLSEA